MSEGKRSIESLVEEAGPASEANLSRLTEKHGKTLARIQKQALAAVAPSVPRAQRLVQIRFLAGAWSDVVSTEGACRARCSHCCHINTEVPRSEAELIAKKTGAKLARPETRTLWASQDPAKYLGAPCPFLSPTGCAIYSNRPLACRTLVNLADNELLCELRPGETVPVPYANATVLQGAFASVTQADDWADIREWFPSGLSGAR